MTRLRGLIPAVGVVIVGLGIVAAPVVAADPLLAIVNGIPGKTVDICIGNKEVHSNLRYGKWFQRIVATGSPTVRFRAASSGRCKGTVLARTSLLLAVDADLTLVGTAKIPKVVVYDNTPVPVGEVNWFRVRHASDIGALAVSTQALPIVSPTTAPPVLQKGQQTGQSFGSAAFNHIWVWQPSRSTPFLEGKFLTRLGERNEFVIVGTKPRNARFVAVTRPTLAP